MKPQTGPVTASQFDAEPIQEGRCKYKSPHGRERTVRGHGDDMADVRENQPRGRNLRPLAGLLPYLSRYRSMVAAATVFLVLAAATTLALPLAVRRMVDHGFASADGTFINN